MPNELPKGAVLGYHDVAPGDRLYCVINSTNLNELKVHILKPFQIHPDWFKQSREYGAFLFKNYWDARAYVLKREHDRSTRNKEVPEQGTS